MITSPDQARYEKKCVEVLKLVRQGLPASATQADNTISTLMTSFISIRPPVVWLERQQNREETEGYELVKVRTGLEGVHGTTRKPGNLLLNWQRLFDVAPDVTIAAAGLAGPKWLVPFIALYVWNKLWAGTEVVIGEKEAVVLWSLWRHAGRRKSVSEEEGYDTVQQFVRANSLKPISEQEYHQAITNLLRMRCIDMNEGIVHLRENVLIEYT